MAKQDETKQPRKMIDWEAVEIQYRAGIRSLKEIGGEFGVSDAGIIKRAKKDGWVRDLKAKIQAKADAKVSAAAVSAEVSARTKATEHMVIESNATMQANVRLEHRRDVQRMRRLALVMMTELEAQSDDPGLFEELGELLRSEDDKGQDRRNDLYQKVISSASRIDSLKKLSDVFKTLFAMERQAFGINDDGQGDPVDALGRLMVALSGNVIGVAPQVPSEE